MNPRHPGIRWSACHWHCLIQLKIRWWSLFEFEINHGGTRSSFASNTRSQGRFGQLHDLLTGRTLRLDTSTNAIQAIQMTACGRKERVLAAVQTVLGCFPDQSNRTELVAMRTGVLIMVISQLTVLKRAGITPSVVTVVEFEAVIDCSTDGARTHKNWGLKPELDLDLNLTWIWTWLELELDLNWNLTWIGTWLELELDLNWISSTWMIWVLQTLFLFTTTGKTRSKYFCFRFFLDSLDLGWWTVMSAIAHTNPVPQVHSTPVPQVHSTPSAPVAKGVVHAMPSPSTPRATFMLCERGERNELGVLTPFADITEPFSAPNRRLSCARRLFEWKIIQIV